MTHSTIRQIERARHATNLLKQGVSILDTVHEAGYFDQAHLTRSLKYQVETEETLIQAEGPYQRTTLPLLKLREFFRASPIFPSIPSNIVLPLPSTMGFTTI